MVQYIKSSDGFIDVVSPDGFPKRITRRAYEVIYKARGYKPANEVKPAEVKTEDYAKMSEAELKKIKNDELKAYLDANDVEYPSDAIKEDLINAILGE